MSWHGKAGLPSRKKLEISRVVSRCLFVKNLFYSEPFFFHEDHSLRVGKFEVK